MEINLPTIKCLRCGHNWVPRQEDVRQCPNCKTAKWDIPKEQDEKEEIKIQEPSDSPPLPELQEGL